MPISAYKASFTVYFVRYGSEKYCLTRLTIAEVVHYYFELLETIPAMHIDLKGESSDHEIH